MPNLIVSSPTQFPFAMLTQPAMVVRPAWDTASTVSRPSLKKERTRSASYTDKVLLGVFRSLTQSLTQVEASVFCLELEVAQSAWQDIKRLPAFEKTFPQMKADMKSGPPPADASEVEREFWNMTKALVSLVEAFAIAADSSPVDEDSPEYHAFLGRMLADVRPSKLVHGRKALYALFED